MRWRTYAVATALSLPIAARSAPVHAQQTQALAHARRRTAAEQTLFRLEDEWAQALIHRDAVAFRRLIAPGWVYTDERGVMGRAKAIAEYTQGADTVEQAGNEGMRAYIYENAAVVTGILVTHGHGAGGPFDHRYRYTDTWVRRGATWRAVASQDYDIPRGREE